MAAIASIRNIIPLLQFATTPTVRIPRSPGVDSGFGHFYWNDRQATVPQGWPDMNNTKEEDGHGHGAE
jgi:hypothetical protein